MTTACFVSGPYGFQLAEEEQSPDGWRVLFRSHFHLELEHDARLPTESGGFGSTRPTEVCPDEKVPVASWILGRLAYLLGPEERGRWLRTDDGEIGIAFDVHESRRSIAHVQLVLSTLDVRLVGRMARSDFEEPIAQKLKDALLAHPDELAEVKAFVTPDVELGFEAGKFLGAQPRKVDAGAIIARVMDGEEVPRLADDREERCPLSRGAILNEYVATSRRPPRKPPRIEYLQSLTLGSDVGWLFRITAGRNGIYALVRNTNGTSTVEWWD